MRIDRNLSATVYDSFISIEDMEQLIAEAQSLGMQSQDRIHVDYHRGDPRDQRERGYMIFSVRKAPHQLGPHGAE